MFNIPVMNIPVREVLEATTRSANRSPISFANANLPRDWFLKAASVSNIIMTETGNNTYNKLAPYATR